MSGVFCLNCDQPVERMEVDFVPTGSYLRNQPCGCEQVGVLFDFKPSKNDQPGSEPEDGQNGREAQP
jgi:hypothetical protein